MDMLIRSEKIITASGILNGTVAVKEGKIVGLFDHDLDTSNLEAEVNIDARNKVVLPGVIDTHAHIRFPSHPEWEDLYSGTTAAAAGGITTVFEMPVSSPGVRNARIVLKRMEYVEREAVIDVGLYAGGGHDAKEEYQAMADAGIIGFKIFLHRPSPQREHDFKGIYTIEDGKLLSDLQELKSTNRIVCFHAENDSILEYSMQKIKVNNIEGNYHLHSESHPVIAETEAVSRVIQFAEYTGTPVSIVHLSSPESAQLVQNAKSRGVRIYAETCPHYLFFSEKDLHEHGPYAKINPPLRSESDRIALWEFVRNGTIDYIGTDHAPFSKEEKERGIKNIFEAPSGIPGFDTALPLLLTAVSEGKINYEQLVKLTSENQARIFGINDQKGSISIGKDADFAIIDPNVSWQLNHQRMKTKAKDTAKIYDGFNVIGKVGTTVVRGKVVFNKDSIKVKPGYGKVIKPLEN